MGTIRILYKAPGLPPEWREVPAELDTYQDLVGGYIVAVPWNDKYWMVCNEDGKLQGLEINFFWREAQDVIVGPVFFVAECDEDFASILDDEFEHDIAVYTEPFWKDDEADIEVGLTLGEIDDALRELR